jgi:hypothetical protein
MPWAPFLCWKKLVIVKEEKAISEINGHSFISNPSYDRSTVSSKTIPPLNAI